jgi:serine/threonine protein kinase
MGGDTTTPSGGAIPDPFGLVGARLEGKYDIQSVVAEGGFGVVYRAMHRTLHKPIAVKVLKVPETLSDGHRKEFLDKFAQEARTIAQFEHPAIVRVIDFGASPMPRGEAAPWMVLEWLQGATLEEDFERRRGHGRSPAEVLAMLQPIFEALAYAHDEGIAHRDIKPGNIMLVANRRGEVSARLLDFGIAKFMSQGERASGGMTATRSGLPAFSPMYAAPEQLAGSRTGPWTDVHAMALVLSEALVGSPVYPQDDNTALYAAVLSPVRPTPGAFGVQVGAWEPVLQRALSVRPDLRYAHMRAFANDLTQALGADAYAAAAYPSMPYGYGPTSGEMPAAPDAPAPGSRSLLQTGYGDEPTAQISRAAFVQEAGASQQGGRMPLAIAPTHMASTQGAPAPSTFLPVTTQSMPSAPPPPAPSRWKPWAAVAVLALGVGAAASVAVGSRSTSPQPRAVGSAPVTPLTFGAPAAPAAPVNPVETQPAALPAVVAAPVPQPAPVVRRTAPVVSPGVAAAPTAPAPPAPSPASPVVAAPSPPPAPPPQPEPVAERPAPEPEPEPEVVAPPPPVRRAVVPARPVQPALPSEPSPLPAPLAPPRAPRRPLHHTEIPLS